MALQDPSGAEAGQCERRAAHLHTVERTEQPSRTPWQAAPPADIQQHQCDEDRSPPAEFQPVAPAAANGTGCLSERLQQPALAARSLSSRARWWLLPGSEAISFAQGSKSTVALRRPDKRISPLRSPLSCVPPCQEKGVLEADERELLTVETGLSCSGSVLCPLQLLSTVL